jgi:uncharacterized protein Smg (DUF494 family)
MFLCVIKGVGFEYVKSLISSQLKGYQIDIYTKDEIEKLKKDIRGTAMHEETNQLAAAFERVLLLFLLS